MNKHIKRNKIIGFMLLIIFFLSGCREKEKSVISNEYLPVFVGKEINVKHKGYGKMAPVIDNYINIKKELSIEEKVRILCDYLSEKYFHKLKIEVLSIDSINGNNILLLELMEKDSFKGPGSLPSYESWYDFFQGSTGGANTTIILKETLLQRYYKGKWIDGIIFNYQGSEIEEWDHINLNGTIYRYE